MFGEEKRVLISIFLLDPEKKLLVSLTSITYSKSFIDAVNNCGRSVILIL